MVEFTQGTPQAQGPGSYVGLSEGIRSSPNTSVATLFEGLADALKQGVGLVDQEIKRNIEQDVFDAVDSVQAEFGVPDATDIETNATEFSYRTAPVGVTRAVERLQTLQTAYASGDLKESHYWARMNSMVRQLRGKYPGYRAEIDQMVASVTGARPANALRSALFSEWEAATNRGLSDLDKFVNANLDTIPPDYFDKLGTPSAYTYDETRAYSARKNREKFEMSARSQEMSLLRDQGNLTTDNAVRNFRADANQIVYGTLKDLTTGIGKSYQGVISEVDKLQQLVQSGAPETQQNLEMLRGQVAQLRTQMEGNLLEHFMSDPAYAEMVKDTDRKDAIDAAMSPIRLLEDALANQDFGLLKSVTAAIEARTSDTQLETLRNVPVIERLAALEGLVGGETMKHILAIDDEGRSVMTRALYTAAKAGHLLGQETLEESVEQGLARGAPAEYFSLLSDWSNEIEAADTGLMTPEVFLNKAQAMLSYPQADEVMNNPKYFANDRSRYDFFSKMAAPSVSKKMMSLRDKGHQEAWELYQGWTARTFVNLFMSKVQTIQGMVTDPNQLTRVTWNDANARFDVDLRLFGDSYIRHPLQSSLKELNQSLAVIRPILEDQNGDIPFELKRLLTQMGYDPAAPQRPHFLKAVWDALTRGEDDGSTTE